jgi:hypothetical protein
VAIGGKAIALAKLLACSPFPVAAQAESSEVLARALMGFGLDLSQLSSAILRLGLDPALGLIGTV